MTRPRWAMLIAAALCCVVAWVTFSSLSRWQYDQVALWLTTYENGTTQPVQLTPYWQRLSWDFTSSGNLLRVPKVEDINRQTLSAGPVTTWIPSQTDLDSAQSLALGLASCVLSMSAALAIGIRIGGAFLRTPRVSNVSHQIATRAAATATCISSVASPLATVLVAGVCWFVAGQYDTDRRFSSLPFVPRPTEWLAIAGVLALIIAPTTAATFYLSIRRQFPAAAAPTECATCGYSLKGLASTQCPECGRDHAKSPRILPFPVRIGAVAAALALVCGAMWSGRALWERSPWAPLIGTFPMLPTGYTPVEYRFVHARPENALRFQWAGGVACVATAYESEVDPCRVGLAWTFTPRDGGPMIGEARAVHPDEPVINLALGDDRLISMGLGRTTQTPAGPTRIKVTHLTVHGALTEFEQFAPGAPAPPEITQLRAAAEQALQRTAVGPGHRYFALRGD